MARYLSRQRRMVSLVWSRVRALSPTHTHTSWFISFKINFCASQHSRMRRDILVETVGQCVWLKGIDWLSQLYGNCEWIRFVNRTYFVASVTTINKHTHSTDRQAITVRSLSNLSFSMVKIIIHYYAFIHILPVSSCILQQNMWINK